MAPIAARTSCHFINIILPVSARVSRPLVPVHVGEDPKRPMTGAIQALRGCGGFDVFEEQCRISRLDVPEYAMRAAWMSSDLLPGL